MAIYWPTPGFKGRTFKLCVLTRWDFNFCVRSSPLRGTKRNDSLLPTLTNIDNEKLMMFVRVGSRQSGNSRSDVGRGSSEQEVGFDFKIVAFGLASVSGWNDWKLESTCWSVSLQLVSNSDCSSRSARTDWTFWRILSLKTFDRYVLGTWRAKESFFYGQSAYGRH